MKKLVRSLAALAALAGSVFASADATPKKPVAPPRIEVCFVLDTTGSMSGLIEGAKQKIWAIANQMIAAKPKPELKFALVAYRDRGDAYIVTSHPLTDDLDAIYAKLREFHADGGGDWPESVNAALEEAIRRTAWSTDKETLKLVFLVGDAPPHMDYPDDVKYPVLCAEALKRGIIINTVQCGHAEDTRIVWREIAKLGEGEYSAIAQEGGMREVETPFDKRLSELNRDIGTTIVPYGGAAKRAEVQAKQGASEEAAPAAASDRLMFNAATAKTVQGGGELLDALKAGAIKPEAIEKEKLPEDWRKLDPEARQKKLAELSERRATLQTEINALARDRSDFLKKEEARVAADGKGDGFDAQVGTMFREQAKRRGLTLE